MAKALAGAEESTQVFDFYRQFDAEKSGNRSRGTYWRGFASAQARFSTKLSTEKVDSLGAEPGSRRAAA